MIKSKDFAKDGKIDWIAYRKAQIDAGEICKICSGLILSIRNSTGPRNCNECVKLLTDKGEVTHRNFVRCPKCHNLMNINDWYSIWEEDDHNVSCDECGHEFTIQTYVERTFESPEIINQNPIENL